jgi:signal transduction histidine kinase
MKRHKLIERQLLKHVPNDTDVPVELINAVSAAYSDFDEDRRMIERSMEISSKELLSANREMLSQNSELEALFRITQLLYGRTEMKSIFYMVAEEISIASNYSLVCFELFDEASSTLEVECMIGPQSVVGPCLESKTDLQDSLAALLCAGEAVFVCADMQNSPRCTSLWRALNVRNVVSVPMIAGPTFWGTLTIAQFEGDEPPSRDLSSWLQTVAGQVASGLERGRLSRLSQDQAAAAIAESKMYELGKMAGGIAHEINTPLGTILLIAEDLAEQASARDLQDLKPSIQQIIVTVNRIATIVKGLKMFSRDGSSDPFIANDVSKIVNETIALCGERFRLNLVDVKVEIAPNIVINCRETQVSQLLLNLLNNSFDAVQGLENRWILVAVRELNETIELSVTDSGQGIPTEIRDKLALPFFTTKAVGLGTGLGLSIATGIAKDHGGKIAIDTTSLNTKFVVTLAKNPESLNGLLAG